MIRDGRALEKAGKITAIIFDKTGTLTFGKPEVAAISEIRGQNSDVRILAAAARKNSAHPISQAIGKKFGGKTELSDWKEIRGSGIEAKWQGKQLLAPPKRGEG